MKKYRENIIQLKVTLICLHAVCLFVFIHDNLINFFVQFCLKNQMKIAILWNNLDKIHEIVVVKNLHLFISPDHCKINYLYNFFNNVGILDIGIEIKTGNHVELSTLKRKSITETRNWWTVVK